MKKFILAAAAVAGLGFSTFVANVSRAEDAKDAKEASWTGALIDNHCGDKQKDEAAALKHDVSCSLKPACSKSGFQLVVGDKHYKLDDHGNERAREYLKDAKANKVTIEGKIKGDEIDVSSIKEAKAE